ncbi:MAG: single-stranded DNA-binding protein [Bacteroidetes bacterium]|nr:single-stranded DNA-binding protein [Bacteroidota bacterium]
MSVNKVILVGNLGKDPEIKYVMDNVPVATFSLATTESYKDKDGNRQDKTEWHNIVAWRGLAIVAEKYLQKGKQVYIEGKITSRTYDDKDGVKRYFTEIVAEQLQMLGKKEDGANSGSNGGGNNYSNSNQQQAPAPVHQDVTEATQQMGSDDLPF